MEMAEVAMVMVGVATLKPEAAIGTCHFCLNFCFKILNNFTGIGNTSYFEALASIFALKAGVRINDRICAGNRVWASSRIRASDRALACDSVWVSNRGQGGDSECLPIRSPFLLQYL